MDIDWGATGVAEILQNVRTLVATREGEAAWARSFGLSRAQIDKPASHAAARAKAEIVAKLARYEPRAEVTRVRFLSYTAGAMRTAIAVRIRGAEFIVEA